MPHNMIINTLGVGDAYDGENTNASVLVRQDNYTLLVDCGPTVPAALFRENISSNELDAIYITHTHPDHCLGLTTILNWMNSKLRTRPIKIIVQQEQKAILVPLVKLAHWPIERLKYDIEWCSSETISSLGPWDVQTAPTQHAVSNLSLHLRNNQGCQFFYSGDGKLYSKSLELASQSNLVFVECETIDPHVSHGSWSQLSEIAINSGSQWKLYHIDPTVRTLLSSLLSHRPGIEVVKEGDVFVAVADWSKDNVV